MALITFTSDFGTTDHYVAAVKAAIYSSAPSLSLIDISHDIRPFDILHAAQVVKRVYMDFPERTVHLIAVDAMKQKSRGIAGQINGHYFVGFDCGLFSLIGLKPDSEVVAFEVGDSIFPAREVLAGVAISLAEGTALSTLGTPITDAQRLLDRKVKANKREMVGHVVSVDHYGNLISNIEQAEFEKILSLNGDAAHYQIRIGRESFGTIHGFFTEVESGECFVCFNSFGVLQIGINKGNASQLLGLSIDSPVVVEFING